MQKWHHMHQITVADSEKQNIKRYNPEVLAEQGQEEEEENERH